MEDSKNWTDERVAALLRYRAQGSSAGQIASWLGLYHGMQVTRSAVLGKLHRMGKCAERQIVWTDERDEMLRSLYADRENTVNSIAQRLGTSYSAVSNRCRVLGLQRKRIRGQRLRLAGNGAVFVESDAQPPRVEVSFDVFAPLPGSTPKPLEDHERGECHWPVGERLCCCEPVAVPGEVYCLTHKLVSRSGA